MISIDNLTVCIKGKNILHAISCRLMPNRIAVLIGQSGAGKTTLLKTLAGLLPFEQGAISIDGNELKYATPQQRAELIGYVFQDFNLFCNLTVLENCIDPQLVHGADSQQARQKALQQLQAFGMNDFINAYPAELSGGQKQRVALARTLCLNPRVLLLDEPTASLDPINTDFLIVMLKKLAQNGLVIVLSSQDMSFVRKVFDDVYYIADGTIVESCHDNQEFMSDSLIASFLK
ncbi:MAG: ATP-binding cassette domain-containing protein [Candidatus Dependentiae bacterium]